MAVINLVFLFFYTEQMTSIFLRGFVGREFLSTSKQVRIPAVVPPNGASRIKRRFHVRGESGWTDHVPPRVVPLIAYLAATDLVFLLCPPRANSPRETETGSASIGSLLQDTMGNISSCCGNNTGRATRRRRRWLCQLGRIGPAERLITCCPPGRLAQETREPGQVSLDADGGVSNT